MITLAVMGLSPLLSAFIWIVIVGLIFWLLWWAIGAMAIPEPFNKVIRVVLILIAVVVVVNFLLGILGRPF